MRALERWAAVQGCALVALATRRAAPFYRAVGYEESATYFRKVLAGELPEERLVPIGFASPWPSRRSRAQGCVPWAAWRAGKACMAGARRAGSGIMSRRCRSVSLQASAMSGVAKIRRKPAVGRS
jgi:hypothetical protein